jgi:hypothetical protein
VSEPVTWQLLEHVRDAIKLIKVSRGFRTDIGNSVVALEASQLPEDDAPATLVLALDIPVNEESSTKTTVSSDMDIVIEVTVPFSAHENAQLVAHRARADVIKALIPLRKELRERPRFIRNFQITGSSIGQPDDGASVVIAQVTARAGLTESQSPAN